MNDIQPRPTIQDMLKAAMAGTLSKVDITNEANIQAANQGEEVHEEVKTASPTGHITTEQIDKLASAMEFIATKVAEEGSNALAPGSGPGALDVSSAMSSEANIEPGAMGTATSKHVPPKNPAIQTEVTQSGKANTGLETNDAMSHPEQPTDPWGNEKGKTSSAQVERLLEITKVAKGGPAAGAVGRRVKEVLTGSKARQAYKDLKLHSSALPSAIRKPMQKDIAKEIGKTVAAYGTAAGGTALGAKAIHSKMKKKGSAPIEAIRQAAAWQTKEAEDAINPASISSGKDTPPDASASEEAVPAQPSDVTSQAAMVGSNDAAIAYTKGKAKADPKSDVNKVLTEPALSAATDKTLQKVLDNTGKAGVKISSIAPNEHEKIAAVRALIGKLAADHEDEKKKKNGKGKGKEKDSMIDPSPQSQMGGVSANTMGGGGMGGM